MSVSASGGGVRARASNSSSKTRAAEVAVDAGSLLLAKNGAVLKIYSGGDGSVIAEIPLPDGRLSPSYVLTAIPPPGVLKPELMKHTWDATRAMSARDAFRLAVEGLFLWRRDLWPVYNALGVAWLVQSGMEKALRAQLPEGMKIDQLVGRILCPQRMRKGGGSETRYRYVVLFSPSTGRALVYAGGPGLPFTVVEASEKEALLLSPYTLKPLVKIVSPNVGEPYIFDAQGFDGEGRALVGGSSAMAFTYSLLYVADALVSALGEERIKEVPGALGLLLVTFVATNSILGSAVDSGEDSPSTYTGAIITVEGRRLLIDIAHIIESDLERASREASGFLYGLAEPPEELAEAFVKAFLDDFNKNNVFMNRLPGLARAFAYSVRLLGVPLNSSKLKKALFKSIHDSIRKIVGQPNGSAGNRGARSGDDLNDLLERIRSSVASMYEDLVDYYIEDGIALSVRQLVVSTVISGLLSAAYAATLADYMGAGVSPVSPAAVLFSLFWVTPPSKTVEMKGHGYSMRVDAEKGVVIETRDGDSLRFSKPVVTAWSNWPEIPGEEALEAAKQALGARDLLDYRGTGEIAYAPMAPVIVPISKLLVIGKETLVPISTNIVVEVARKKAKQIVESGDLVKVVMIHEGGELHLLDGTGLDSSMVNRLGRDLLETLEKLDEKSSVYAVYGVASYPNLLIKFVNEISINKFTKYDSLANMQPYVSIPLMDAYCCELNYWTKEYADLIGAYMKHIWTVTGKSLNEPGPGPSRAREPAPSWYRAIRGTTVVEWKGLVVVRETFLEEESHDRVGGEDKREHP